MNAQFEESTDPSRQLTNLRQVIVRSEAAIVALQKLVSVAQGKIRILEAQTGTHRMPEQSVAATRGYDTSSHGLKMFQ